MDDKLSTILNDAADLLEREGWIQGALESREGRCAVGAIRAACGIDNNRDFDKQERKLIALSRRAIWAARRGLPFATITAWNDHPARTREEVITALRKAARDV